MSNSVSIVEHILGSLANKVVDSIVDTIAQQLSYLFKRKSKFQKLRDGLQVLKDAQDRVQKSVDEATRNGEEIFDSVIRWQTKVEEQIFNHSTTQRGQDEEKAKKRCLVGLLPNFNSRYQLSKKADKDAEAIAELLKEKDQFNGVFTYRPVAQDRDIRPIKYYEAFESRRGALDGVMEALKDEDICLIGVHGMGGVGKTTLVKEVVSQAYDKHMFNEVVFVDVTQVLNEVKVQGKMANKLGLTLDDSSMGLRADRLCSRLKREKKVLIILDNLWEPLKLEALGIPSRDEHPGCKILVTSRILDVLELMDSSKNFAIDILTEDEAWNLFKKTAGEIVERSDVHHIAMEVAKKCAGLPIAIATVAKALKHKENLLAWKNALGQLKRPSKLNLGGIPRNVYAPIELSYNFLEDRELQLTFLLCSIMGHNAAIEDLLRYSRGLDLFRGFATLEDVRVRVSTLVDYLKNSSLLLASSSAFHFDMHDVVRDVAISIASRDHHWVALGREGVFEEWSNEEIMRSRNLLSLQNAKVSDIPDKLECPNVSIFSIGSYDRTLKVPDNFFMGMPLLKVSKFSKMKFSSLPSSIRFLKNIHTLCFSGCELDDISIIGGLINLEILSFLESKIEKLPGEIAQLTKLKLLELSNCNKLKVIYPDVLAKLSRLEELYLYDSFDGWEEGHDHDHSIRSNASLFELQHLSRLTILQVHIPNEQAIPKDNLMLLENLERHKISIGTKWDQHNDQLKTSKMLKLKMDKSIHLHDGIKTLLKKSENLHLDSVKDMEDVLYDPYTAGLSHLKHLCVCNISEIKCISDPNKLVTLKTFPLLESLSVSGMVNLEVISYGQLQAQSFGQLKVIEVCDCEMLKNLFSFSTAKKLHQLQEIKISGCNNMKELIGDNKEVEEIGNEEVSEILEFGQLRILRLEKLQSFVCCMCSGKMYSSRQKSNHATSTLFDQKILFPKIEKLELEDIPIGKIWIDPPSLLTKSFNVQNLTILKVKACRQLKYAFACSMVMSFVQLKRLVIQHCDIMEEVIVGEAERSTTTMVFPKLDYLELSNLPNLKRFCSTNIPIEFLILRKLTISNCPVLNTIFHCDSTIAGSGEGKGSISKDHNLRTDVPQYLFNKKVAFPVLERLYILFMENLERIWATQLAEESFVELFEFRLYKCDKLVSVFPLSMKTRLQRLENMWISDCELVEEIFESSPPKFISSALLSFEFPHLTNLQLLRLPKLKNLYHKIHTAMWPSLKEMNVWGCDEVEILFASQETNCGKSRQYDPIQQLPLFWVNKFTFPKIFLKDNNRMKEIFQNKEVGGEKKMETLFGNLVDLEVVQCHGIINLVTNRTAKTIAYLREMKIKDCENIIQVLGGDDDDEMRSDISFPKLQSLELNLLPKLESFCTLGNYTFEFSSLTTVVVQDCPNMKMFSRGKSKTPLLHKVQFEKGHRGTDRFIWGWEHSRIIGSNSINQRFQDWNNRVEDEGKPSTSNTRDIIEDQAQGNASTINTK